MPTDKPTFGNREICQEINEIGSEAREISREQKYDVSSTIMSCGILVPSKDKYASSNAIINVAYRQLT